LPVTRESLRYNTSYFYFMWISAFVTTSFQRPILMAITAGMLSSIIMYGFSLEGLDSVRIILKNISGQVPSSILDDFKKLAAGGILSYIGAGLAFIASVIVYRKSDSTLTSRKIFFSLAILLFGFIGCILLWSSDDASSANLNIYTRSQLFDCTEGTVAVLIIFLVGLSNNITPLIYVAAFLSAFYNLSSLDSYLQIKGKLAAEHQTGAGYVFNWLSALFMVFFCAFLEPADQYNEIGTDSHA